MWNVLLREVVVLEKQTAASGRRNAATQVVVPDKDVNEFKAKLKIDGNVDFSQEEKVYQKFLKFYEIFTAGTMEQAIIARKGIVKYEALAVKAKDYFILLKPSIDLKKLQSDVKTKFSAPMAGLTPSSTALKQIKSEAAAMILETSSMISGIKRQHSEAPSLLAQKDQGEKKRETKALDKGLL